MSDDKMIKELARLLVSQAKKQKIDLESAKQMLQRGEEKAKEIAVPVVISVVDDGGNMVAQHKMDGALLASISISLSKAYTAVALQSPTHEAAKSIVPGQPLYGLQNTNDGKLCLFGGGFPITVDGVCVGGIGVSGGSVEQDMCVAEYILEKA